MNKLHSFMITKIQCQNNNKWKLLLFTRHYANKNKTLNKLTKSKLTSTLLRDTFVVCVKRLGTAY